MCDYLARQGQKDSYAGESQPESNALGDAADSGSGEAAGDTGGDTGGDSGGNDASKPGQAVVSVQAVKALRDFTAVPASLEAQYERIDAAGSVRPIILTPSKTYEFVLVIFSSTYFSFCVGGRARCNRRS